MIEPTRTPAKMPPGPTETPRTPPGVTIVAPSLEILGGQGVQARALVEALRRDGYRVGFVPINPNFPPGLRWLRRFPFARTLLNEALYLPRLLRLRRGDVAHIFSASYWSFVLAPLPAMLLARLLGKRIVLHYHSGEAADHLERFGLLVHPWLPLADAIVVPSDYLREIFASHGRPTRVIRNVVDTAAFSFRDRIPLRPRLLSTRNLEPYYRVDNTLRAFDLLRRRHPGATLTVAGYGREEGSLRRLAAELRCGGIRFVGRVEPEAMPRLYDDADIFVNSSVVDNQPVSILEAFAAGLAVVSTGTGAIARMVGDGERGRLVPPGDPEAMADAIGRLLDQPERARGMALAARREAESYAWARVRGDWAEVYSGATA